MWGRIPHLVGSCPLLWAKDCPRWVAVEELNLIYQNSETILHTINHISLLWYLNLSSFTATQQESPSCEVLASASMADGRKLTLWNWGRHGRPRYSAIGLQAALALRLMASSLMPTTCAWGGSMSMCSTPSRLAFGPRYEPQSLKSLKCNLRAVCSLYSSDSHCTADRTPQSSPYVGLLNV